ncbi:MAG TPA: hypothetical protein VG389_20935, partial [Myxococcota bacterium]|nr:hypothetical protein [Myxococcota bacterium]
MTTRRGPLCTAATAAALAAAALATTGCPSALSKLAARIEPFDPDETPGALKELDDWMRAHVEDKESAHAHLVAARGHFDWLLYAMDREDVGLMADLAERLGKRSACAGETAITPACFSSALAEVHELFDAVRVRDLPSEEKPEAESGTDLSDPAGLAGLGSDYVRTLAVAAVGHRGMASRAVALKLVHARAVLREAKKAGEDGLVARLAAAWPFPCPAHFADLPALHGDALADALEHCDLMEGYRGGAPSERALLDEHHDAKPAVVAVASAAVAAPPVDAAGVAAAKAAGAVASGDAAGAAAAKAAAERAAAAAEAAEAERAAAAAEAERAAAAAEAERAAAAA